MTAAAPLRVGREGDQFVVDAELLAAAFGLAAADVPVLMRENRITSRSETGQDENAGRFRLTFFHAGRALRLTIDADGVILKQSRFDMPDRS